MGNPKVVAMEIACLIKAYSTATKLDFEKSVLLLSNLAIKLEAEEKVCR